MWIRCTVSITIQGGFHGSGVHEGAKWQKHVNTDEGGVGVRTLCPLQYIPHKQVPCVGGQLECVPGARERLIVGVVVSGWVGKVTMLLEGHCERNRSCIGGQNHGQVLNSKIIAHTCAILA